MNDDMNKEAQGVIPKTQIPQIAASTVGEVGASSQNPPAAEVPPVVNPAPAPAPTYNPPTQERSYKKHFAKTILDPKMRNISSNVFDPKFEFDKDNVSLITGNQGFMTDYANDLVEQGASDYDYYKNYQGADKPKRMTAVVRPDPAMISMKPDARKAVASGIMNQWRSQYKQSTDQIKKLMASGNPSDVQYAISLQSSHDAQLAKQAKAFSMSTGTDIDANHMKSYFDMDEKQAALIDGMQSSVAAGVNPTQAAWDTLKSDPMGTLKLFATNPYARGIMVDSAKNYASDNPGKAILIGGLALLGVLATIRFASGMLGGGHEEE